MSDGNLASQSLGRLDISIPEMEFEAGKPGTISILIKNPFDTPIDIIEVIGPRSSHLQEEKTTSTDSELEHVSLWKAIRSALLSGLRGLSSTLFKKEVGRREVGRREGILLDFQQPKPRSPNHPAKINEKEGSEVAIAPTVSNIVINSEECQRVEPHCDTVLYITVSTTNWLMFAPRVMSLNSQIKYSVQGIKRTQVISTSISVKPPIKSTIIGSICGAILGSLAKLLQTPEGLTLTGSAIGMGGSAVMGLIATIALSRKSGTQGFITVEDFYGGFALGALIGYGGSQYFEQAIVPEQTSSG